MLKNQNIDTRLLVEEGIVIKKELKKETQAGEFNGKKYEAKPERYIVSICCSPIIDDVYGFMTLNSDGVKVASNPIFLEYELAITEKKTFDSIKFADKVVSRYTYRNFNGQEIFKPLDFKKNI